MQYMLIILKLFCCYQTLTVISTKLKADYYTGFKNKKTFFICRKKKVLHKNKFIVTVVLINRSKKFLNLYRDIKMTEIIVRLV